MEIKMSFERCYYRTPVPFTSRQKGSFL